MTSCLSVVWVDPIRSVLKAMTILTFDLQQLRFGCVVGQSPMHMFLVKLALVPAGLLVLVVVHIAYSSLHSASCTKSNVHTILGASGFLVTAFFSALCIVILGPFQCVEHPNGERTVLHYPSVVCWSLKITRSWSRSVVFPSRFPSASLPSWVDLCIPCRSV